MERIFDIRCDNNFYEMVFRRKRKIQKIELGLIDSILKSFGLVRFKSYKKVIEKLMRDEKTGLFNTKILDTLDKRKKYSVIYIDMDNMKKINDKYGHHIGDIMILAFSEMLKNLFKRTTDKVIRSNNAGDEFIVVTESGIPEFPKWIRVIIPGKASIKATFTYGVVKNIHGEKIKNAVKKADEICMRKKRKRHSNSSKKIRVKVSRK